MHTGAVIREGEIEILDGVQPGEVVVVYGQKDVVENDLVNVDWLKWTHRTDVNIPKESQVATITDSANGK